MATREKDGLQPTQNVTIPVRDIKSLKHIKLRSKKKYHVYQ